MARTKLWNVGVLALSTLPLGVSSPAGARTPPPRPDLVIGALTLSHDKAAPGSPVQVELTVENRGSADAGPFRVAIYHSEGRVVPRRGNVTRVGTVDADLGLRAGKRATFSVRVLVPPCEVCRPGSLYAFADAWGTVLESSEDNNFRAVPIDVSASFRPNLRVEAVKITPDRGPSGREVLLTALLRNTTPYAAQGPFKLGVYCSDDTEMTRDDLLLSSWPMVALAGEAQATISRKIPVDARCPVRGQHVELGLMADLDDSITESDESDNSESAAYWVFRAPDLVPGRVALSRAAAPPGTRLVVSHLVRNEGKTAAQPFKIGVYLSRDATIEDGDTLLTTHEVEGLAAQTTSGLMQHDVVVPELPSGNYFVGVVVDMEDRNGELRERNNLEAVPFAIRRVDLTDRWFFLDKSTARPGDALELRFALRNTGSDPSGPFKVGFYFSANPRLDSSDERIGVFEVKRLGRGAAAAEHTVVATVPASAADGYRWVLMATDDGDGVAETDELNNVALRPLLIRRK